MLNIAKRSLSYAKIVQASAIQACLNIAECSLSYAKIAKILEMSIDRVISCLYEVNGVFPL